MDAPARSAAPQFPPLVRLARALGVARGMFRQRELGARPEQTLVLFSMETCPACRRVRAALNELDLDYVHRSCPRGSVSKREALRERGGKVQVPYLVDPNSGVELYESKAIVRYLHHRYGVGTP